MLGKYDFDEANATKVLEFFYPALSAVTANIELLIEQLEIFNLDTKFIAEILDDCDNLEFLDQFQEIRAKYHDFTKNIFPGILNSAFLKDENTDLYKLYDHELTATILVEFTNTLVTESFDRVANGGQVFNKDEVERMIVKDVKNNLSEISTLNADKQVISKELLELIQQSFDLSNVKDFEEGLGFIVDLFERENILTFETYSEGMEKSIMLRCYYLITKSLTLSQFMMYWIEEEQYSNQLD